MKTKKKSQQNKLKKVRKDYSSPRLTKYGTLKDLTASAGMVGGDAMVELASC